LTGPKKFVRITETERETHKMDIQTHKMDRQTYKTDRQTYC